ncbi:hypothetical protein PSA7680_01488 [Pseudoruegeria aquimaris]|uniref:Uncharacterized protein n=1 Tax=Pseudoruegeria aquimaris TaxID=393663 RepID=A0A1Y5S293_9RHOB|nr:hypothetical protein [Pseudoruegeria aquimaris]SLN30988.1 hypothetical protein PSA7680_01488 [Pseudoruegeria aquimaris]
MPALVRLYITHSLIGFGISAVFVAILLWFNVANLWHLVTHSNIGWMAVALLVLFNGIVFSGVQFGIAIMRMAEEDDDAGGKRDAVPLRAPLAVPVPVESHRKG